MATGHHHYYNEPAGGGGIIDFCDAKDIVDWLPERENIPYINRSVAPWLKQYVQKAGHRYIAHRLC